MRFEALAIVSADGRPILEPLTLDVPAGCSLLVLGESGSGKSSLLEALAGISRHVVRGEWNVGVDSAPATNAAMVRLAVQDPLTAFSPYRRLGGQVEDGWFARTPKRVGQVSSRLNLHTNGGLRPLRSRWSLPPSAGQKPSSNFAAALTAWLLRSDEFQGSNAEPRSASRPTLDTHNCRSTRFCLGRSPEPHEESRHRFREIVAALGLDPGLVGRSYPHELSIGMLRRVLVAAVLAADPPLALFDEPTSGVDPSARWAVFDAIRKWSRTFIVATHDADLLRRCSTEHVLRLYRGRAVQDGPARGDGGGGARSAGPAGDGGPKGDGGPAGEGGATP